MLLVEEEELDQVEIELLDNVDDASKSDLEQYLKERNQAVSTLSASHERVSMSYDVDARQSVNPKKLAGDTCQVCGAVRTMACSFFCDIHHVTPLSHGGFDRPDNILIICPNCHRIIHRGHTRIVSRSRKRIVFEIDEKKHSVPFMGVV